MALPFATRLRRAASWRFMLEWFAIGCIGLAVALLCAYGKLTERADFVIYDQLLLHRDVPPPANVVIVGIDNRSISQLGRWPWPRAVHAELLRQLARARPQAVIYDVLFTEPAPGDTELARAMTATPTYLPLLLEHQSTNGAPPEVVRPVPPLRAAAAGIGHINVEVDRDGILRSVALFEGTREQLWPQLAVPVYQALRGARAPLPGKGFGPQTSESALAALPPAAPIRTQRILLPFSRRSNDYPQVSFDAVLRGEVPPEVFRDKIVIVGATASGMHDRFATPISGTAGELAGVTIYANVLDALLGSRAIEMASTAATVAASMMPALMLLGALLVLSPLASLLMTVLLAALSIAASAALLYIGQVWLTPMPALVALLLIYPLWNWRRLEVAMSYLGQELEHLANEPHLLPQPQEPARRGAGDVLERHITLTKQAAQRQRDMRRFIWDSLNSLPEPILVAAHDGRVLLANAPAHAYFGARALGAGARLPELFGTMRFVHAIDADGTAKLPDGVCWPDVLVPDNATHAATMMRGLEVEDKSGRHYLLRYARFAGADGKTENWIASLVDVTEMHAAQRQRDELLHLLSHDMRSPQASILALLATERPKAEPAGTAKVFEQVERYARRTLALADDFVQLARAESQTYSLEPLDLAELALDASDEIWPLAKAKHIEVRCTRGGGSAGNGGIPDEVQSGEPGDDRNPGNRRPGDDGEGLDGQAAHAGDDVLVDGDSKYWVLADGALMTRALINLLSNAVKYSLPHTRIDCVVRIDPQAPHRVCCIVRDHGYGIAPEQQAHLFERFRRFRAPGQPVSEGVGLGMAFVKTVVERHRGEIAVQSAPGQGTTVTISLPRATA